MSEGRDGPGRLLPLVLARYALSPRGIHGVGHWGRVLENGRRLAGPTGADPAVLEWFALLHDSCRRSDGRDPSHGKRAAALARTLRNGIDLDDERFELLLEACDCHTRGPRSGAPVTVLTCLDSDRLDIPRVGFTIRTELLFTAAGRSREVVDWATRRASAGVVPAVAREEWGWQG